MNNQNSDLNSFYLPLIGQNTRLQPQYTRQNQQHTKCTCVPSGRCHLNTLTGCPHQHYYKNNVWTRKN